MKKLRTTRDIQNYLEKELGWRIQEIANLKKVIPLVDSIQTRSLLRAGIPILYAHWEGFVKKSSEAYLNFIAHKKLSYRELKTCFILFGLKKEIKQLVEINKITPNIQVAEFFLTQLDNKAKIFYEGVIDTQSNLSSLVFEEIAISIGIDPMPYKLKYKLIDESLLKRRNQIAHGEHLDIDTQGYQNLSDEVVALLRAYKTDIENSISQNLWKKT
jgi:hypothetical protein